jgi:hypothetical protein
MEAKHSGPLCYGDIVSLFLADGPDYTGFLSTLGYAILLFVLIAPVTFVGHSNIDNRVVVRPQSSSRTIKVPRKFRGSLEA